jgi:hypothetical protein
LVLIDLLDSPSKLGAQQRSQVQLGKLPFMFQGNTQTQEKLQKLTRFSEQSFMSRWLTHKS